MVRQRNKLILMIMILLISLLLAIPSSNIIEETEFIDFSHPSIQNIADDIKSRSNNKFEQITFTAEYVYDNIDYMYIQEYCLQESASDVVERGFGDCASMSKLNAAILSALGIPTRIMSGCVSAFDVSLEYKVPIDGARETKILNFTIKKPPKLPSELPANKLGGTAHAWVRAYDGKDWISVETTAGVAFPTEFESLLGYLPDQEVSYADGESMCYADLKFFEEECSDF